MGALIIDVVIFLVIGLIAGAIASFYLGRQQELVPNLLTGTIGAIVGGFIARLLGLSADNVIGEIVLATAGAVICLFLWQRLRGT
jgi:uncharacterized membrane protein YeaQ/YmgE (transglycosylase-associated protein family)